MKGSIFKSAIIGGVILFVWYAISWMVIPWNNTYVKSFKDTEEVARVIKANASEHAVYYMSSETVAGAPFMAATIIPEGKACMGPQTFLISIATQILAAFLLAWMISKTKGLDYFDKVKFITVGGLFAAVVSYIPDWNWMGFPASGTLILIVSTVIGWFLAGLAMAKVVTTK